MAHVLNSFIIGGRFDNRHRGFVSARLWLRGRRSPVKFKLYGNFLGDVAGSCIVFGGGASSDVEAPPLFNILDDREHPGVVGDMTLAKDIWEPRLTSEGRMESVLMRRLSLEWFLPEWGRFLIEGDQFKVRMTAPNWLMEDWEEDFQLMENKIQMRRYATMVRESLWNFESGEEALPLYSPKIYRKIQQHAEILNSLHSEAEAKYGDDGEGEIDIAFALSWNHILEAAAFMDATGENFFESEQEAAFWAGSSFSLEDAFDENERNIYDTEPACADMETLANHIHEWARRFPLDRNRKTCPIYSLLSEYAYIMERVPLVVARMRRGEHNPDRLLIPLERARTSFKIASTALAGLKPSTPDLLYLSISERWSDLGKNIETLYETIRHRG